MKFSIIIHIFIYINFGNTEKCIKKLADTSFVCVCNKTLCGLVGKTIIPQNGQYVIYSSSKDQFRLDPLVKPFYLDSTRQSYDAEITIKENEKHQTINGFGGAFTDSFGIQLRNLSPEIANILLESYFSENGIEYSLGRVPIGGTDCSTRPYSYADNIANDTSLNGFALQHEDYHYKIPYIQQAQKMNSNLRLVATPWSPPKWMKINGEYNGKGGLKEEFKQVWANYFVKFLEAYEKQLIPIWALTPQSNPASAGLTAPHPWNSCGYSSADQSDFIKNYLGPTLARSKYGKSTRIIIYDDTRNFFGEYPLTVLNDPETNKYVSGVGLQWYMDFFYPISHYKNVYEKIDKYGKFILNTESCAGFNGPENVLLGSWERAEAYVFQIIEHLNNWSTGWIDWNMALDEFGGPNWADNKVDSAIIVNTTGNEFYKQPMYYAMGHFSKFISKGDSRIGVDVQVSFFDIFEPIVVTAVSRADGLKTVVVFNRKNSNQTILIKTTYANFSVHIPAKSFNTILFY